MTGSKIVTRELKNSEEAAVVKFHNNLEGDDRTVEQWIWEY